MNILTIKHLTKTYPKQSEPAVSNVSISLKKGEILGLIGESGSGKTTLLRLIAGLEEADEGTIHLKKEPITGPAHHLVPGHPQIRLVHQDFKLAPNLSIRENIAYSLRAYDAGYRTDRLEKMIALCDLAHLQHKLPRQLSGGEMQRVALARALADEPMLLLLDEPFSNVDTLRRQDLKHEIRDVIQRSNTTAIFVTHDTTEALTLSDSLAVMQQGRIIQQGTARNVYQHPITPYVAKFFGYANITQAIDVLPVWLRAVNSFPFQSADLLCIRAEHVQLCTEAEADFMGRLKRIYYLGYGELWEVTIAPAIVWQVLVYDTSDTPLNVNDHVFLKINWSDVHLFA